MTALMAAAYYGQKPAAELLLGHGANVEARNNDGATALMFAASKGRLPTMRACDSTVAWNSTCACQCIEIARVNGGGCFMGA